MSAMDTTETLECSLEELAKSEIRKFVDKVFNNAPFNGQDMNALKQEVKERLCKSEPEKLEELLKTIKGLSELDKKIKPEPQYS